MRRTRTEIAHERVSRVLGPQPKTNPVTAGIVGAMTSALAVIAFEAITVGDSDPSGIAFIVVVGLGFAIPFGYFYYLMNRWGTAAAKEYLSMTDADEDEG